jgi:hypothetical protein
MTTIHIAATPLWQQFLAPVVGGGVGGVIAYLTAVRSLNKAAQQAEDRTGRWNGPRHGKQPSSL